MAGLAFGEEAARGQIVGQIVGQFEGLIGKESASVIQTMIAKAGNPQKGVIANVIGLVVLLVGASAVFIELQDSLNSGVSASPVACCGVSERIR